LYFIVIFENITVFWNFGGKMAANFRVIFGR